MGSDDGDYRKLAFLINIKTDLERFTFGSNPPRQESIDISIPVSRAVVEVQRNLPYSCPLRQPNELK